MKIDFPLAVLTQANLVSNRHIVPIPSFIPDIPCRINDPDFLSVWSLVREWTYLDAYKAKQVWDLAIEARDLEGDFIECGSHRGGLGFLLGFLIRRLGLKKRVFLCDSFEGMPEPDPIHDSYYRRGMLVSDLEKCCSFVEEHGLASVCEVMPGWFDETFKSFGDAQRFSLVHIDCDIYQSTKTCFEALYPRASARAPFILDDFYIPPAGERTAALECLSQTRETLEVGPVSQVYFRKGVRSEDQMNTLEDAEGTRVSLRELSRNEPYLAFLRDVLARTHDESQNLAQLISQLDRRS